MKVKLGNLEREVKKFQEGGEMAPEEAQMAPEEAQAQPAQDPMQEILNAAMQAVQTNDGQLALQVCAALVQLAQGAAGGQEPAPAEGEPVYRKGGRLAYRRK
jgi:hypothetical protein